MVSKLNRGQRGPKRYHASPFIGIINVFQADVFLVLEQAVKLGVMSVKAQLG